MPQVAAAPCPRMPARRRTAGSRPRSRPPKRKPGHVSLGVGVALTRAEIRTLKDPRGFRSTIRRGIHPLAGFPGDERPGSTTACGVGVWGGAQGSTHRAAHQPRDAARDAGSVAAPSRGGAAVSSYVARILVEALAKGKDPIFCRWQDALSLRRHATLAGSRMRDECLNAEPDRGRRA